MIKFAALTFGLAMAASGLAYAGPFQNGDFNDSAYDGNAFSYVDLAAGDTSITGWTVETGTVDLINTYWQEVPNNPYSLDMSGTNAGSIAQTFDTVANQAYNVTFDLAGNPAGGPAVKELLVSAGAASANYFFDTTNTSVTNMGWELETFSFIATGSETTLTFASLTDTSWGPALSNVNVQIPEPAGLAMFGIGLLGLGFAARRRA